MSIKNYHLGLSIRGSLDLPEREFSRRFKGTVTDDDGNVMTVEAFRDHLFAKYRDGFNVLPMTKECDNFDKIKGCQGHLQLEQINA